MNAEAYFKSTQEAAAEIVEKTFPKFSERFGTAIGAMRTYAAATKTHYRDQDMSVEEMLCKAYDEGNNDNQSGDLHIVVHPQWPLRQLNRIGLSALLISKVQKVSFSTINTVVDRWHKKYVDRIQALLASADQAIILEYPHAQSDYSGIDYRGAKVLTCGERIGSEIEARMSPQAMALYLEGAGGLHPSRYKLVSGASHAQCAETVCRQLFWSEFGMLTGNDEYMQPHCDTLATALQIQELQSLSRVRMRLVFDTQLLQLKGDSHFYALYDGEETIIPGTAEQIEADLVAAMGE